MGCEAAITLELMMSVEEFWDSITDTVDVTTNPCVMCGETSTVKMLVHH